MRSPTAPTPSQPSAPPFSTQTKGTPEAGPLDRGSLAVYIHWPYCLSKCPYCDFNSHARQSIGEEEYLSAAAAELRYYAGQTGGRPVTSIFFGGGTPSLMATATVEALLGEIASLWPVAPKCEITLEANPSSADAGRFAGYREAGVNRVSLGVQSLHDSALRFLGRAHNAAEARQALGIAARYFERVNFDLIYALPGQTADAWRAELSEALPLARGHLSLYQLTIEPGTPFFHLQRRGRLQVPGGEFSADLYELTQELCEVAGLPAYEVSNHAGPGQESRHNLTYWRYGDYIGVGPGAHGRIGTGKAKIATAAIRAPAAWAAQVFERGHGAAEVFELGAREQAEEMLLMGLRLGEGLDLEALQRRCGHLPEAAELTALQEEGLLLKEGSRVRTTAKGRLVLNAVIETLAGSLAAAPLTAGEAPRGLPATA
jgi:putative oxygen-independent coproporphyrinogen III oxidase